MKDIDEWKEVPNAENCFFKIKKINSTYYKLHFNIYFTGGNTLKVYIGASSGKKRRDLDNFTPNNYSRDGGIRALMWMKEEILSLPDFLKDYYIMDNWRAYLCIRWADSKRRDVYSRLQSEGFYFIVEDCEKILMKKVL